MYILLGTISLLLKFSRVYDGKNLVDSLLYMYLLGTIRVCMSPIFMHTCVQKNWICSVSQSLLKVSDEKKKELSHETIEQNKNYNTNDETCESSIYWRCSWLNFSTQSASITRDERIRILIWDFWQFSSKSKSLRKNIWKISRQRF